MSVLAQIKRECRENRVSTKAGTLTGSHLLREIATSLPVALTHNTAVHLLIHLSRSWVVCAHAFVLALVHVCLLASVCVCVCVAKNGCFYLGRGVCTGTDREEIELKRMRQIPPATRSLIHTAIVLKSRIRDCHVVL